MNIKINENQKKAIEIIDGPVLIIAGPGSGKTFTLVERIAFLISKKNVKPENILVGTFTEKAAKELITRISNKLLEIKISVNLNDMYIGTLHSICLRIIDENIEFSKLKKNYRVFDQFEQQYFIYRNLKHFQEIEHYDAICKNPTYRWSNSSRLIELINKVSEEFLNVENLIKSNDVEISVLGKVYKKYCELLSEDNSLDFSSIQLEAYNLLRNKDVLEKINSKILYLMIDEYQDTNSIQEKIIMLLAGKNKNLCVVGDDDQGLYRFRGATIRNILEFPDTFNNCEKIYLDTNYRSHPDIIKFFNKWMSQIEWGKFRFNKEIKPRDDYFVESPCVIKVSGVETEENWQKNIYDFIIEAKNKKIIKDYNQIAFLFRSVSYDKVINLANFLESKSIPVYSPRSEMFFDREEIKDIIAVYLFLFSFQIEEIFEANTYSEDIKRYYENCLEGFKIKLDEDKKFKVWLLKKSKEHSEAKDKRKNFDYGFTGLFYQILEFDTLKKYIDTDNYKIKDTRAIRNLAKFSKILAQFEFLHSFSVLKYEYMDINLKNLFMIFINFLKKGGIAEYEDMKEYAPSGCVSFMTIHQAKGLEFPIVFVDSLYASPKKDYDDLDENLQKNFYSKKTFEPLEKIKYYDFWRLFYTAFSRAQNLLILSCPEHDGSGRKIPTKEFQEIYKTLTDWKNPNFNIEKLKLAEIKEVNIKESYSFTSDILLYENCPLQYKYFKEFEFAPVRINYTVYGTVVHQTIEDIHKAVLRGEEHIINNEQIKNWFEENYSTIVKKEKLYLAEQIREGAIRQIQRYAKNQEKEWWRIKDTEVDISLVKDKYILSGKIDLISGDNDTLEIIDFKSGEKPDLEEEFEKIERQKRQLEVYAHILEEKRNEKVSRLHLYYTGASEEENPRISFDNNLSSIQETIKSFDDVVSRIEKKEFTGDKKRKKICKDCDMRYYCDNEK